MLKEHEKFWAFIVLVAAVIGLAASGAWAEDLSEQQIRLLEKASDGLLVVLGAAGLALFRSSSVERDLASAARTQAEKVPPLTGEAANNEEGAPWTRS